MIKNYFIVAFRNLKRKKLYTCINLFSLGLGLSCCILMALFVKHEWTHDGFHEKNERLFRVVRQRLLPNGNAIKFDIWDTVHPPWLVDALKDGVPGVVQACAFMASFRGRITQDEKTFQQRVGLVSADFFTMFTFPFLAGDPTTALSRPDGVVITETTARKIFGDANEDYRNVIGQLLILQEKNFIVTGIMADVPLRSSLQFDVLIHIEANKGFAIARGGNDNELAHWALASIYVQTAEEQSSRVFEDLNRWNGKDRLRQEQEGEGALRLLLQPLKDVYWNAEIPNHYESKGANPTTVYILWTLAIIVLFVACSNFITMSISESSGRAMEVGLRKVLGASPGQIMKQFWSEALLLSFLGLLLGIAMAELFLPVFNGFVHRDLNIVYLEDGPVLLLLLVVIGLLAGSYHAVVLSRLQPVPAIKGGIRLGSRSRLTRALIVLQYSASIALMICIGVMIQQQNHIRNKNLGYNQEQIAIIRVDPWSARFYKRRSAKLYKQEILKDPRIVGATISDRTLTTSGGYSWTDYPLPDGTKVKINIIGIDADYLPTLEIPLLEGRNFSEDHPSDREQAVLINETLAKQLNIEDPVGKILSGTERLKDPVIIGVVRDFHFKSLHQTIAPLVLRMEKFNNLPSLFVRIRPGHMLETIDMLKKTWNTIVPNVPSQLSFLEDNLNRQYRDEEQWRRILTYSAFFTIAISCFGLFGLASLAVTRRTKEIGIRKVLGASVGSVVWLLSRNFFKLLFAANVIAWPVAYWAMNKWLANFAYHIEPGVGIFVLVGALTLGIAQLTILMQIFKVAYRNPVDALRYE